MRDNPTARTVVDGDIPGDLNVFLEDEITVDGPDGATTVNITENEIVPVPAGEEITINGVIENRGGTGSDNPDSCDGGGGTLSRLVLAGNGIESKSEGVAACVGDNPLIGGPGKLGTAVSGTVVNSTGNSQMRLWVEGVNTGLRVTPIYGITLDVSDGVGEPEEPPSDDPDDPVEEPPDDPVDFGLGDVTATCDIEAEPPINPGDSIEVDVDLNGFSPDATTYEVFVDLYVNGSIVQTGSGFVTANGGNGPQFEVTFDQPGEYEIGYNVTSFEEA